MARHYRSIRRNNGKRLTSRMRGGMNLISGALAKGQQLAAAGLAKGQQLAATAAESQIGQQAAALGQQAASNPIAQQVVGSLKTGVDQLKTGLGQLKEKRKEILKSLSTKASYIADKQLEDSLLRLNALGVINIKVNLDVYRDELMYNAMDLFMKADEDRSGDIDVSEFLQLMTDLKLNAPNNADLFKILDTDGSGSLDLKEFTLFYRNFTKFNETDKADAQGNKDGNININEFNELMNTLGYKDKSALFSIIDTDGSKNIDLKEFIQFMVYMQNFIDSDEDESGKIEIGEFQNLMKKAKGMNDDVSKKLFSTLDTDGSGTLELDEFIQFMVYMQNFIDADEDKSGKIEIGEFQILMKKLKGMNEDASKQLFLTLNTGGSGSLELDEFIKGMYPPPPFNPMIAQPQMQPMQQQEQTQQMQQMQQQQMQQQQMQQQQMQQQQMQQQQMQQQQMQQQQQQQPQYVQPPQQQQTQYVQPQQTQEGLSQGGSSSRSKYTNKLRKSRNSYY